MSNKLDSATTLMVTFATVLMFITLFCGGTVLIAAVVMVMAHFFFSIELTWLIAIAIVFGITCTVFLLSIPGVSKYE